MQPALVGQSFAGRSIATADDFAYTDPVDGSLTSGQGLRLLLDDGSRVGAAPLRHRHPGSHPAGLPGELCAP